MSSRAPLEPRRSPEAEHAHGRAPADILRRRESALRVRRRRALLADGLVALVVAVVLIASAPGLAVVALVALLTLLACGASLLLSRSRTRRWQRRVD